VYGKTISNRIQYRPRRCGVHSAKRDVKHVNKSVCVRRDDLHKKIFQMKDNIGSAGSVPLLHMSKEMCICIERNQRVKENTYVYAKQVVYICKFSSSDFRWRCKTGCAVRCVPGINKHIQKDV